MEPCKSYSEYYKKYKEGLDFVKQSEGLIVRDTLIGSAITYLKKGSLAKILSSDISVCDKQKIMRYSLTVGDENGEVTDSIVEITNAYQYEAIFFTSKVGTCCRLFYLFPLVMRNKKEGRKKEWQSQKPPGLPATTLKYIMDQTEQDINTFIKTLHR